MKNKRSVYFLLFSFFSCLSIFKIYAQGDHFIYIQADAKQAFNAVVNNKNYTSSAIGYLIVPGLSDGNCNVAIRFPEDSSIQLNFPLAIDGKDEGFQLKNFGAKGWGLFNLQTMDVTFSGAQTAASDQTKAVAKSKAFGDMLSDVVNDSTLNKPVAQPAVSNTTVSAPSSSQQPVSNNAAADLNANQAPAKPAVTDAPAADNMQPPPPATNNDGRLQNTSTSKGIIKTLQESETGGTKMIFVDAGDKNDTVNIFIPAVETSSSDNNSLSPAQNTGKTVAAAASSTAQDNPTNTNTYSENNQESGKVKNNANPFYAPVNNNNTSTNSSDNLTTSTSQPANSNCTKMAEESDLYKLRKRMIAETDANEMIVIAKKQLKGKCLSTQQVKGIGALFLSDEARYNFYEAMYKFTYDPANYISLQNQLLDDYYRKRFQALVH